MPNPFPGMDPYLEGPMWGTVHSSFIEQIAWQLSPKLLPRYRVLPNTRVVLATLDEIELPRRQVRLPDVGVFGRPSAEQSSNSTTLVAPLIDDALMTEPEPIEQKFLEIREAATRTLVTAIEVLSPTNKRGDGLDQFRAKRQEFLAEPSHYLEIDLLRIGTRFPVAHTLPSVPYFVFLSRANLRPRVEIWPFSLDQPLPTVPIPLLDNDPDVSLDLQLAWNTIYEHYRYGDAENHQGHPVVPLSDEQQAWADECLRKAGLQT